MQKKITQFVFIAEVAIIFTLHAIKINQNTKISSTTSKLSYPQPKKVLNIAKSSILYIN